MNKPASKQIEVQIMGQSYLLACPEGGESALLDAVERVDTAMCRIRDAGKVKARDRIAVLASLNLAFELSQKEAEHFEHTAFGQAGAPSPTDSSNPVIAEKDLIAQARIDELIRRLDNTLGNDGQLL